MLRTKVINDIVYADSPKRELDIYLPATVSPATVLVWYHGGGMTMNTKSVWEVVHFGERFSREGLVVIAPDYRKSPHVSYPVYVEDAAGAYLAAMVAMAPQFLAAHDIDHLKIKGLIPVSGQMDTHQRVREEREIAETGFYADDAAPWKYIKHDLFPILIMAAENDMPCRADINRRFSEALHQAGHNNSEYIEIPGREHVSIIEDILEQNAPVAINLLHFTQDYLN